MAEDAAERTEPPTPKRIEDARKKGDVANSRDVSSLVVLAAAFLGIGTFTGSAVFESIARQARSAWGGAAIQPGGVADFHALLLAHGAVSARAFLPFAILLMVSGLLVGLLQTGPLFSAQALAFRASRISPVQGVKRLFSPDRLFDLAKAPLKVAVVGVALGTVFGASLNGILALATSGPAAAIEAVRALSVRTIAISLSGLAVLAAGDFAYVHHRYRKKLRMSIKQVREELRDRDGSPQVRSRRRQMQLELSRHRMIAEVAKADLVLTNPTHVAVALRYVQGKMAAPAVLARGRGVLAERIRREARRHDVPIIENPPLARLLYRVCRVGREIPENLFGAVAEVLAIVYRIDRSRGRAWGAPA